NAPFDFGGRALAATAEIHVVLDLELANVALELREILVNGGHLVEIPESSSYEGMVWASTGEGGGAAHETTAGGACGLPFGAVVDCGAIPCCAPMAACHNERNRRERWSRRRCCAGCLRWMSCWCGRGWGSWGGSWSGDSWWIRCAECWRNCGGRLFRERWLGRRSWRRRYWRGGLSRRWSGRWRRHCAG